MSSVIETYFEWPTLPFSVMLCLVSAYWVLMVLSGIDLFDFDLTLDGDGSMFDWGLVGLRWLNLGEVPLMIWLSAFIAPAWLMSAIFDRDLADPTTGEIIRSVLRNAGVGLLVAKATTQPLRGVFNAREPNTLRDLLGRTCVVTTVEATASFGQARCPQDGAPLLLNIQTTGETLPQGTAVEIVDYSPQTRTYLVRSTAPDRNTEHELHIEA